MRMLEPDGFPSDAEPLRMLEAEKLPLVISTSGEKETCPVCGTVYDRHELMGYVPPYGDGCGNCSASDEELAEFTQDNPPPYS